MTRCKLCPILVRPAALALAAALLAGAQAPQPAIASGKRYPKLIVRNATVIEGNGTPASGPKDIVIENGQISEIVSLDPGAAQRPGFKRPESDVQIDATGKYVMP